MTSTMGPLNFVHVRNVVRTMPLNPKEVVQKNSVDVNNPHSEMLA